METSLGRLWDWTAEIFYLEQMGRHLRDWYRDVYQETYGYSLTPDEIDRALMIPENHDSAFYDRFARSP